MATITASLERSLQNCSLDQTTPTSTRRRSQKGRSGGGGGHSSLSDSSSDHHLPDQTTLTPTSNASFSDDNSTFVELNSHISLPYHWEQCLDLKTGEIYYVNWSNGMKVREDPRTTTGGYNGDYELDEEEEGEEEKNNGYDDSDGSSTESYPSCSSSGGRLRKLVMGGKGRRHQEIRQDSVLVVAGCKNCLMYHMVPKHVEACPKCSGQLLHFPPNPSSSP